MVDQKHLHGRKAHTEAILRLLIHAQFITSPCPWNDGGSPPDDGKSAISLLISEWSFFECASTRRLVGQGGRTGGMESVGYHIYTPPKCSKNIYIYISIYIYTQNTGYPPPRNHLQKERLLKRVLASIVERFLE